MKKLYALLLALAMVLSMAACGGSAGKTETTAEPTAEPTTTTAPVLSDEEAIIGEWVATFNLSEMLATTLNAAFGGIELAPKAALNLKLSFEFETDGTGEMTIKVDSTSLKDYTKELSDNMVAYLYTEAEAAGESKEALDAEILAETGMTTADYVAEQMSATMDAMVGTMSASTDLLYKMDTEKGIIYIGEDQDELDSEKETMTYTLDGDTLTITEIASDGEDASAEFEMFGMGLPWVMERD